MNYYDKTLLALDRVKKQDSDMVACFAFGSFVSGETSLKHYKEIRVFDGSNLVMSKFNLMNIYPDIDMLCISNNPDQTKVYLDQNITDVFGHYVTINVVSPKVFERELFSNQPGAIKRIVLYRKLIVVKGDEYIQKVKAEVKKIETPIDSEFQQEFNFKKEYLNLFAKYNVATFTIGREDYEKLFPNIYKFITGKLQGGFPEDRIKLVYPEVKNLKSEINLSSVDSKEII